jgi:hypothetical protein
MPFPLAHPAAVLPFRRYCPRFLSFPALVIGSLSPDAGYLFGKYHLAEFSHRLIGSVGFCLPVGIVALLVLYGVVSRIAPVLPNPFRRVLLPLSQRPVGSPLVVVISVVLGACLHIVWDSFTHKDGWMVEHLAVLQWPIALVGHRTVKICHLLWYASTFAGVVWLFMAYQRWLQAATESSPRLSFWAKVRNAVLIATVMLAIGMVHHLVRHPAGDFFVVGLSALLAVGFAVRVGKEGTRGT